MNERLTTDDGTPAVFARAQRRRERGSKTVTMDEVSAVFHLPINEAAKEVSLNLKESRARFEKRRGRRPARARVDGFDFFLSVRETLVGFFLYGH